MIQAKTNNLYYRKVSFGDGGALQSELDSAVSIVQSASYMTRSLQNVLKGSLSRSSSKKDYSPVTVADYAVQALIVSYLSEMFPGDGFVAEEDSSILRSNAVLCDQVLHILEAATNRSWSAVDLFDAVDRAAGVGEVRGVRRDAANESKRRTWVLDPIDGMTVVTKSVIDSMSLCLSVYDVRTRTDT
jgi:3'(2'), 5'-bisphosphate nucleotidase